jgi:hypothetical protein
MHNQDVLKKVRDLLRLQRRAATEGEAQAAAFALGKLLTKHQLDIASIETEDDRERPSFDEAPLESFGRMCRWRIGLARVLCDHLGVSCWLRSQRSRAAGGRRMSILLCGRPTDTAAVHSMYGWLMAEAQRLCASKGYKHKLRNDWLLGFVTGIGEQLREAKKQVADEHAPNPGTPGVAIVLASRINEAEALMAKTFGKTLSHRMRPALVYMGVYDEGKAEGRAVHLGKHIAAGSKQLEHGA